MVLKKSKVDTNILFIDASKETFGDNGLSISLYGDDKDLVCILHTYEKTRQPNISVFKLAK